MLLVVDEIQSGMGRTGRFLACEHEDIVPDVVVLSKGLAAGMPLGATIAPTRLMTWPFGAHANTFGGHPISCVTALVALRHLFDGGLIDRAGRAGERLIASLKRTADRSPSIGEVRGRGLMVGVEIVKDRANLVPAPEARNRIIQRCFEKGLLVVGAGHHIVRFLPALVVTDQQIDQAVALFTEAVVEIDRELPHAA
jgi:4-aminobutyrate aminotransferase